MCARCVVWICKFLEVFVSFHSPLFPDSDCLCCSTYRQYPRREGILLKKITVNNHHIYISDCLFVLYGNWLVLLRRGSLLQYVSVLTSYVYPTRHLVIENTVHHRTCLDHVDREGNLCRRWRILSSVLETLIPPHSALACLILSDFWHHLPCSDSLCTQSSTGRAKVLYSKVVFLNVFAGTPSVVWYLLIF